MSGDAHNLPAQAGAVFVGRERELALLRAALAAARGGWCSWPASRGSARRAWPRSVRATPATLELWRFLVTELHDARILVVGTYRDTEGDEDRPLAQVLGTLPYQPLVQRMLVSGLSADEIGVLIAALAARALGGAGEATDRTALPR